MDFSDLIPKQGQKPKPDGVTFDDLVPAKPAPPPPAPQLSAGETALDAAKSFGQGAVEGVAGLIELPQTVVQTGLNAGSALALRARKAMGLSVDEAGAQEFSDRLANLPRPATALRKMAGIDYKPQTTAGEYAKTVGEFLPGAAAGGGSLPMRVLTQAVVPGVASEAAGQAAKGTVAEPYARVAGALAGSMLPSMAARAITPNPISAERQAAVQTLRNEGVTDLTAGQITGNKRLMATEAMQGGRRAADMVERQGEQFTAAALRRTGTNAARATPDVIDDAFNRIGQQFDDLAVRNSAQLDQQFGQRVGDAFRDYNNLVAPSSRAPVVENTVRDLAARMAQGAPLDGAAYQAMRSRIDRVARGASRDPQLSGTLRELRNALDDAMERAIAQNNPADLGAWREARNQYRNMLVVEKASTGAGAATAEGLLSPSQLRNATVTGQGRRNYARGQGDFADLARSGEAVMKPLPDSGTAWRMQPTVTGGLLGAGAATASPVAVAAALAPMVLGRALMTRPVQSYLANQALTGAMPRIAADAKTAAVVNALLEANQAARQIQQPR